MSIKITMPDDFGKRLEKAVRDKANAGVARIAKKMQAVCDIVFDGREGKTPDALYAELESGMKARDFNLPEEHLRAYADAIAEGRRVVVEVAPST